MQRPLEFTDIYVSDLLSNISLALSRPQLFNGDVVEILKTCRDLCAPAQTLLARLINLHSTWIPSRKLIPYLVEKGTSNNLESLKDDGRNRRFKEAIDALVTARYFVELNEHTPFESCWEACSSLTMDEIKQICKEINAPVSANAVKSALLSSLHAHITSTRTLFGSSLKSRLHVVINKALKSNKSSPHSSIYGVTSKVVHALRRILRLAQCTCREAVQGMTAHYPAVFRASLSATWGMARFPSYTLTSSEHVSLFSDRAEFEWWENACDLKDIAARHPAVSERIYFDRSGPLPSSTALRQVIVEVLTNFQQSLSTLPATAQSTVLPTLARMVEGIGHTELGSDIELQVLLWAGVLGMVALVDQVHFASNPSTSSTSTSKPPFFAQFHPGSLLAGICSLQVEHLEKEHKEYRISILILRLLLASPYLPGRRGKWYTRLCIDFDHLGGKRGKRGKIGGVMWARRGVRDEFVEEVDRIGLLRRVGEWSSGMGSTGMGDTGTNSVIAGRDWGRNQILDRIDQFISTHLTASPAPPPASASMSPTSHWQCRVCTLLNPSTAAVCAACNTTHCQAASVAGKAKSIEIIEIDLSPVNKKRRSSSVKTGSTGTVSSADRVVDSIDCSDESEAATDSAVHAITETDADMSMLLRPQWNEDDSVEDTESTGMELALTTAVPEWSPPTFCLLGNRIGQRGPVGSKTKFLGVVGDEQEYEQDDAGSTVRGNGRGRGKGPHLTGVEEYVMIKLYQGMCSESESQPSDVGDQHEKVHEETWRLQSSGWEGWHCEGSPLHSLFALLMWDCIYAPIPHVFQTPYQTAPLDLSSRCFFSTRQAIITKRLEWIRSAAPYALLEEIGVVYRAHYNEQCPSMSWRHALSALQLIAMCVGGTTLSRVCEAVCKGYRSMRAGLPDLLLVRVHVRQGSGWTRVPLETLLANRSLFSDSGRGRGRMEGNDDDDDEDGIGMKHAVQETVGDDDEVAVVEGGEVAPRPDGLSCTEAPLLLPIELIQPHTAPTSPISQSEACSHFKFEVLWVEVKSPTDVLADKQLVWLKILGGDTGMESAGSDSFGRETANSWASPQGAVEMGLEGGRAWVCRIVEKDGKGKKSLKAAERVWV